MHDYFLGIEGQESAHNNLTELHVNKRVPHALLFTGTEGIGKFFSAIQFVKLLNSSCPEHVTEKINNLSEPYVKFIFPLPRGRNETNSDTPTSKLSSDVLEDIQNQISIKSKNPYHKIEIKNANNIKINSIREINKIVSLNFDEIPYRAIVINDAHKMTTEAQNAFLKNLEEPPEGIIYILITDSPGRLLTTIRSRCWQINFSPLAKNNISSIIEKYYDIPHEECKDVVAFAQGSVSNAIFLINNNIKDLLHKTILILRYSLARKYFTAFKEFNNSIENNSTYAFKTIVDLIIEWFNDALKIKYNESNLSFSEYTDTMEKFNSKFSNANINELISKLVEYRNAPVNNVSLNLLVMNVIFELSSIGMKKYDR